MSQVRVCFLGTPDFAVTCLKQMLSDEHFRIVGVVTQPDRPSGRKMQLTPSPVKNLAIAKGLRVISPESVNQNLILQEIYKWGAEVAVVVAFGQILSQKFLDLFQYGAVNIHGSLLPRWRGAAPIQRSLQTGETETGVSLQKVVRELDAGDVLGLRKIAVSSDMNAQELYAELAKLGGELLHVELMDYVRGNLAPTPQDQTLVTFAKKINNSESQLNWNESAKNIHNKVRAFVMGPGTWVPYGAKKMKIHRTKVADGTTPLKPGTVVKVHSGGIDIATGDGVLTVIELQPESRNRILASEFCKGQSTTEGAHFGESV